MPLGDSLVSGADGATPMSGLRLAIFALWGLLGVPVYAVGDIKGTAANNRYLWNTLGQGGSTTDQLAMQAEGGKKTIDLLNGTSNLSKLSTALATNKPAFIMGCIGMGDTTPGDATQYRQLLQTIRDWNATVPFVVAGAPDSASLTTVYYNVDGGRADLRTTLRTAIRDFHNSKFVYSDPSVSMGLFTRYPTSDYTTDHLNANAVFYDGSNLKQEGSLMIACGMFADMFNVPISMIMELAQQAGPYQPLDWSYGADVASTTALMVANGPRKNTLNFFTVYNSDSSVTATVTIGRRRVSQDGSTVSTDTPAMAFKVPAGQTVGFSVDHKSKIADRTALTAHYNEGWYVTTTTTCNVRAFGKQVVA